MNQCLSSIKGKGHSWQRPCSFCCLFSLTEWVITPFWCYFLYLMILWIHTCQALVPWYHKDLAVYFMQEDVSLLSSNAWRGFLQAFWLVITHTIKGTQHTGANRLADPYKHILTSSDMCSQQLSVSHWLNNLLSKIYFTEFHKDFAFQKLL